MNWVTGDLLCKKYNVKAYVTFLKQVLSGNGLVLVLVLLTLLIIRNQMSFELVYPLFLFGVRQKSYVSDFLAIFINNLTVFLLLSYIIFGRRSKSP